MSSSVPVCAVPRTAPYLHEVHGDHHLVEQHAPDRATAIVLELVDIDVVKALEYEHEGQVQHGCDAHDGVDDAVRQTEEEDDHVVGQVPAGKQSCGIISMTTV